MLQLAGALAKWAAQSLELRSAGILASRATQLPRLHSTGAATDRTMPALNLRAARVLAGRAARACDRWRCKAEREWMEKWHAGAVTGLDKLRVGVMNVTSLRPHLAGVLGADVHVLCLQEVRLTAGGQAALAPLAKEEGWCVHWGAPMPSRKGGIWGAKQGGVAVLAKETVPLKQVSIPEPFRQALWSTGRVMHVHVALADGRLVVNILSIYAPQRDSREAPTSWTKLTEYVATLGAVPLLIAGDYNVPLDEEEGMPPQILTEVLAGRWVDVDCSWPGRRRGPLWAAITMAVRSQLRRGSMG